MISMKHSFLPRDSKKRRHEDVGCFDGIPKILRTGGGVGMDTGGDGMGAGAFQQNQMIVDFQQLLDTQKLQTQEFGTMLQEFKTVLQEIKLERSKIEQYLVKSDHGSDHYA